MRREITNFFQRHSSTILTIIEVGGVVATGYFGIRGTLKYEKLKKCYEEAEADGMPVSNVEKAKDIVECYWPMAVAAGATITSAITRRVADHKKLAVITTALTAKETLEDIYHDKIVDEIGEDREREIRSEAVHERAVMDREVIENDNSGSVSSIVGAEYLVKEIHGNQIIKVSGPEEIDKIMGYLNYKLMSGQTEWIPYNDFYDEVHAPNSTFGRDFGWNIKNGTIEYHLDEAAVIDSNTKLPVHELWFYTEPRYDYQSLY